MLVSLLLWFKVWKSCWTAPVGLSKEQVSWLRLISPFLMVLWPCRWFWTGKLLLAWGLLLTSLLFCFIQEYPRLQGSTSHPSTPCAALLSSSLSHFGHRLRPVMPRVLLPLSTARFKPTSGTLPSVTVLVFQTPRLFRKDEFESSFSPELPDISQFHFNVSPQPCQQHSH